MNQAGESTLAARMTIDPEKVAKTVENFIRAKLHEQKAAGSLLGLSGGVDSATAAMLAVRAVGPGNVFALHLFDRDSQGRFLEHAKGLAEKARIHFEARDITPLVEEAGRQEPAGFGRSAAAKRLERLATDLFRRFYYLIHAGNPAVKALRVAGFTRNRLTRVLTGFFGNPVTSGFQTKHIVRRQVLEKHAAERNLLLLGAANRSEWLTGWFVKGGVDDLPVEPLLGLYKSQVFELARFLDVPQRILEEPPSPDMFQGLSDESLIGSSWETVDKVLCVLVNGLDDSLALSAGVSARELRRIRALHQRSRPKREGLHEYPSLE